MKRKAQDTANKDLQPTTPIAPHPDQPSTSGTNNPEQTRGTALEDERLNESLESYAQAYNLSALNVKNIIYVKIDNITEFYFFSML